MYVSSGIEIIDMISLAFAFGFGHAGKLVQYNVIQSCIRAAAALATCPVTTPVRGISKNNAFSGHILPNYAASLKYAFSAENSAGIIRQTLRHITVSTDIPEKSKKDTFDWPKRSSALLSRLRSQRCRPSHGGATQYTFTTSCSV